MTLPLTLKPLVRQTAFRPGESLPSLIARLEHLNAYPGGWLRELCEGKEPSPAGPTGPFEMPGTALEWRRLACLSGLSQARLYRATPVRFARVWLAARYGKRGLAHRLQDLDDLLRAADEHPKFCPECLREEPYHRLSWWPRWSFACTTHAGWLVSECPACREHISYAAIVEARCWNCQADLTGLCLPGISRESFTYFVQQRLHAWLGLGPPPSGRWKGSLPKGTARQLIRLFWALDQFFRCHGFELLIQAMCEESSGPVWWQVQDPLVERAQRYVAVMRCLAGWPAGMYEFLDTFASYWGQQLFPGDEVERDEDWLERRWQDFPEVRRVVHLFLAHRQQPARRPLRLSARVRQRPFTWLTLGAVARLMQIPELALRRFIEVGYPSARTIELRHDHIGLLIQVERTAALANRLQQPLSRMEAADWLGLPEWVVHELIQQRRLLERGRGGLIWSSVTAFFASVAQQAANRDYSPIRLFASVPLVAPAGISVTQLLGWAADGRLACCWKGDGSLALCNIAFERNDLEALKEAYRFECGVLTAEEIMRVLIVSRATLERLESAGLLVPNRAGSGLYSRRAVQRLAYHPGRWRHLRELISTTELAIRLGLRPSEVYNRIKAGLIRPASGPSVDGASQNWFETPDEDGWPFRTGPGTS